MYAQNVKIYMKTNRMMYNMGHLGSKTHMDGAFEESRNCDGGEISENINNSSTVIATDLKIDSK